MKDHEVILGVSALGNLFEEKSEQQCMLALSSAAIALARKGYSTLIFDCSFKYGAGLASERLSNLLAKLAPTLLELGLSIVIHHKCGWVPRVCKDGEDPSQFEKNTWEITDLGRGTLFGEPEKDVTVDQNFNEEGIHAEVEQLLKMVQVLKDTDIPVSLELAIHDPDEFILASTNAEAAKLTLLGALRALNTIREEGKCERLSIGSKDWEVSLELVDRAEAMGISIGKVQLANCLTAVMQPANLYAWLRRDRGKRIFVNSGIFNGGPLVKASTFFNYQELPADHPLIVKADKFREVCLEFGISSALVAEAIAGAHPSISGVVLGLGNSVFKNLVREPQTVSLELIDKMLALELISKETHDLLLA